MNHLDCIHAHICSGCDRLYHDRESLNQERREMVRALGLAIEPESVWIEAGGIRDRIEFILDRSGPKPVFGVFEKVLNTDLRRRLPLIDLAGCAQLSPALESWLQDFREDLPPVKIRGSVRLKVAPSGLRGAWFDFSNEDIRDLLDEGDWIERWHKRGVILEAGQRRKRIVPTTEGPRRFKLVDPVLEPWFETLTPSGPTPLFGTIGTFTQPGIKSNHALVKTVLSHLRSVFPEERPLHIAEFGSGIGNFTLPLASMATHLDVFESDVLALEALKKGLEHARIPSEKVSIHAGDFIQSKKAWADLKTSAQYDLIFVDPPRSGLGHFLEAILPFAGPNTAWIYVSCFPESFAKDARGLAAQGLKLTRLSLVEQFPFTHHVETVATFTK